MSFHDETEMIDSSLPYMFDSQREASKLFECLIHPVQPAKFFRFVDLLLAHHVHMWQSWEPASCLTVLTTLYSLTGCSGLQIWHFETSCFNGTTELNITFLTNLSHIWIITRIPRHVLNFENLHSDILLKIQFKTEWLLHKNRFFLLVADGFDVSWYCMCTYFSGIHILAEFALILVR